jgi:hypothetical protein
MGGGAFGETWPYGFKETLQRIGEADANVKLEERL